MSFARRTSVLAAALLAVLCLGQAPVAHAADAEYVNKMRTAQRFLAQGVPDAAAKVLEQVLAKHPDDLRASVTYVDALILMKRLEEAEAFLAQAFERVSETADLYRSRVKLRRAQGRSREALDDVMRVMETNPERSSWAFRETKDLLESGLDPDHTRRTVDDARDAHPQDLNFTVLSAVVVAETRTRSEDALRIMIRFDEEFERDGEAILRFAQEMQNMGDEDMALEGMLAAVERTSKVTRRSHILEMLSAIQERQGKYADALTSLARIATEREGTTAAGNALLRSAEIHQKYLNDPEAALAVYTKIQDDPILGHHRPRMLLQMADCYVRLGRFEEASRKYREVLPEALDPEDAERAALQLAEVEFYRGNIDTALTLFQDMAETYPRSLFTDQAAARYIMINKYRGLGNGETVSVWARMEWARLLGDSVTVDSSGRLLMEMHQGGELAAEALLALAEVADAGGNSEGALGYLQNLVEEFPEDRRAPEALMRQGEILRFHLGRHQEALMLYESVLTDYPNSVQAGDARRLVEALRRELKS